MEIDIKNLSKSYQKGINIIDNLNLSIKSPTMIGLVGPNGAGKTTLMKLLIGQIKPTGGTIQVDGRDAIQDEKYLKSRLGYLPQEFGLYEELSVFEFLEYMATLKGIKSTRKIEIERVLVMTNLKDLRKKRIRTLSGGQKQRVGIAQAFLKDPELLIIDEPTVGLDPEERMGFRNLFSRNAENKIVILSTHIIEDVESICDQIIVLNKGRVLFGGDPKELIRQAENHVGVIELKSENDFIVRDEYKITSRILTSEGIRYRIVGESLPKECEFVSASLEDGYIYCISRGGRKCE